MAKGILGRKIGMTQVFAENGELIPVTVVSVEKNVVLQVKTMETDGYNAVQLGFEDKPERLASKPEVGHALKAETAPKRFIREVRDMDAEGLTVGSEIDVTLFEVGEVVDVTGTSKGKGFQGSIKRHGQSRGPMAHGSRYHRRPGSMGAVAANRVFKGKKLPGQTGGETVTTQNLEVISVDTENNVLLIRGNVPGAKRSTVLVRANVQKKKTKTAVQLIGNKVEETAQAE